jgi:hypothetical protein
MAIDGGPIHGVNPATSPIPANASKNSTQLKDTMLLTYEEVMDSEVSNISAASPTDPQFMLYIKEAVSRIAARGDWPGLVVPLRTRLHRGCITWPRWVQFPRKIADCRGNYPMHGMFYDFLDWRSRSWYDDAYWDSIDIGWRARRNVVNTGWSPVFCNVRGPGRYVRMYHQVAEDTGATVRLFGADNTGNRLRTRNTDGATWSDGLVLTAQAPYAQTPGFVSHIERVIKSSTQGNLTLYGASNSTPGITNYAGYVWNPDNSTWVSLTVVLSALGYPTLQLGLAFPPQNTGQNIGLLYNTDLGSWQNVVAHGTYGNYYLEFGGTPSLSNTYGRQVWNPDVQQWWSLVLRGTIQTAQFLDINDPAAIAPTSVPAGATTATLEPIAEYEPSEINPRYAMMDFHAGHHIGRYNEVVQRGEPREREILALVKLRQLPISQPNDLVVLPPEAMPALKMMVQAVIAGEGNEIQAQGAFTLGAIEHMNRIMEDWMPDEQIPVDLGELGRGSFIGHQRCF